jgi:hypothetical protein
MSFRSWRAFACVCSLSILAVGVAACGGSNSASKPKTASDQASGLTVTVAGDRVTLKRTAKSTTGTAGTSGQVSCTDDYAKLVKATTQPAPTEPWYSATLITWPGANKQSTATLSHALKGDPDLCVAQTSDQSAQAIIYFGSDVKAGVQKLQADSTRDQQAAQASTALKAAAQAAVATVSKGSFPSAASLVQAITAQGLVVKQAAALDGVTETGTMYLITGRTTPKKLVVALKDSKGQIQTVTQGVKGAAQVATAKG